jgi:hypothetical protein
MILQDAWEVSLDFFKGREVIVEPTEACFSGDAGLLPIREFDERIGFTQAFSDALNDPRCEPKVGHLFTEMTRMRVYGILAGYPDQNDHDTLRRDPVFKLIAGRLPGDADLASQPTLSRFENAIDIASLMRLENVLIDQFIESFDLPPVRITLDIDPFDDPTHGQQQLTFWHGYYDQYQYLPRAITCAENDMVLMVALLHGTAHATLGAEDDLARLARRLREAFPGVEIRLRADSGFGTPKMYRASETLDLQYTIGIAMNARLKRLTEDALEEAQKNFDETGLPQREFCGFWYRAGSWAVQRWVVVKVEVNQQGINRRAVVTNRAGAFILPGATCDEFSDRGESENRNKELKCGLMADRLSDHRFVANYFRLYLHSAAANLLARLRDDIAAPPVMIPSVTDPSPAEQDQELPAEALDQPARRKYFNRRREHDPLGQGQPCTWRTRLIKVAAEIVVSTRRVVVRLSGSWPYLHHYRQVAQQVTGVSPLFEPG